MLRRLRPSILIRLIVSLLIIVIPLYATGFVLNNIGAEANRKEMEHNLENSAKSYHRLIETEIQQIAFTMRESAIQIGLLHVQSGGEGEDELRKLMEIQRVVRDVQKSSRLIHETSVYLPEFDRTVKSSEISHHVDIEAFQAFSESPSEQIIVRDGRLYILFPLMVGQAKDGLFILSAELSQTILRYMLRDVIGYERGGAMLYDSQQRWSVTSHLTDAEVVSGLMDESRPIENTMRNHTDVIRIGNDQYIVSYDRSQALKTTMVTYAPIDIVFESMRSYRAIFKWLSVFSLILIIVASAWIYKTVHRPLRKLVKAFREVEKGNLELTMQSASRDEFGYIYDRFNSTISRLKESIYDSYEKELLRQRAELKRLQSQIDPHFLYNTFFVMSRLIRREDMEQAAQFAQYLGKYFQFITRDDADLISLSQEVSHARTYAEIQFVCYPQIKVEFAELPQEAEHWEVPRLILQPLIENAYKHGFAQSYQDGRVRIDFHLEDLAMLIVVEDNGQQLEEEAIARLQADLDKKAGDNTGLVNVHKRLRLHCGGESGLSFARSEFGGLKVEMRIESK